MTRAWPGSDMLFGGDSDAIHGLLWVMVPSNDLDPRQGM